MHVAYLIKCLTEARLILLFIYQFSTAAHYLHNNHQKLVHYSVVNKVSQLSNCL